METYHSYGLNKVKRLEPELTGDNLLWFNPAMARPSPRNVQEVGKRLLETRRALELKKADLCRLAGIATNTYSNWEPKDGRPAQGRPELDQAQKLCDAFGYTLDWIYRGNPVGLPYKIIAKLTLSPEPALIAPQPATVTKLKRPTPKRPS